MIGTEKRGSENWLEWLVADWETFSTATTS